jgi:hypothetical protein
MKTTFIELQSVLAEQKDSKANKFLNYVQIKYFDDKSNFMNVSEALGFLDAFDSEELKKILKQTTRV